LLVLLLEGLWGYSGPAAANPAPMPPLSEKSIRIGNEQLVDKWAIWDVKLSSPSPWTLSFVLESGFARDLHPQ